MLTLLPELGSSDHRMVLLVPSSYATLDTGMIQNIVIRLPGEESVKRFERFNGLDTSLYKTIPLPFVGPNRREGW